MARVEARAQAIRDGDRKQRLAALRGNDGYLVSVAAGVLELSDEAMVGAAMQAFERSCVEGPKRDPQCLDAALPTARRALEALATFAHDGELRRRCRDAVEARGEDELTQAFRAAFPD